MVTATGREADDPDRGTARVYGDAAATIFVLGDALPHERLSPGVDTVGARLMLLRHWPTLPTRLWGRCRWVVVTTVRSLLQPMAADLAEIEPWDRRRARFRQPRRR